MMVHPAVCPSGEDMVLCQVAPLLVRARACRQPARGPRVAALGVSGVGRLRLPLEGPKATVRTAKRGALEPV